MTQLKHNLIPDRSWPGLTMAAHLAGDHQGKVCDKLATDAIKTSKGNSITGTWNVRTLKGMEKLEILVNEMNRLAWNVVGISELRWTGIGEYTSQDGHKIWYAGEENKHEKGVGILVNKNVSQAVSECKPISSRIIAIRLNGTQRT